MKTHALMYHDVVSGDPDVTGFRGPAAGRYKLPWEAFLAHLDEIGRLVRHPPDVADDLLATAFPSSWLLTFDDGGASMLAAGEELARRRWRGHFFVTTNFIGDSGFLSTSSLRGLRAMGHVIGSHTASHPLRISSLSEHDLDREWRTSVLDLSERLGEQIRTASVPGGHYTKRVAVAAQKAGIAALFTSEPVRKPRWVGECLVIGRLSVRRTTRAREAAIAAAGHPFPWLKQYIGWNLRKPLKAIAGERYEELVDQVRASIQRLLPS